MKKEDIEKASQEYAWRGDAFDLQSAFKAGAEWRINSVWHDSGTEPTEEKMLVIINKHGEIKENDYMLNKKYFVSTYTWNKEVKTEEIIKWAYKEDLIPNTEE